MNMKKGFLGTMAIAAIFSLGACCKDTKPKTCTGDEICTMQFEIVSISVHDNAGNAVSLDQAYTVRKNTGQTVHQSSTGTAGHYTVLDDSYRPQLENATATFVFKGVKNGHEVVSQEFVISADCCHIQPKTRNNEVILNLN